MSTINLRTSTTPKEVKFEYKPWITADVNKMIKLKNKLFQRKKRQANNLGGYITFLEIG